MSELIPATIGIKIELDRHPVCYLPAACDLRLATLSVGGRALTDIKALRVIILTCLVLHAASGILEIYAFFEGAGTAVWGNVGLRVVPISLFIYSFYKLPAEFNPES